MSHQRKISVTGLGYAGLTNAVALGKMNAIIAYDKDSNRISELTQGMDKNHEVSEQDLKEAKINFTNNPNDLKNADFHIISVPTPINQDKHPDLSILLAATTTIGKILKKNDIVVYESTVYPGATEEECIPLLEKTSKLICGEDFSVGYSPERINPGDKKHSFKNITKIISGFDNNTRDIIANVYQQVISSQVHCAPSIRVAEATKVIENIQRDVNIALMNEIAIILHHLDIETTDVLAAMKTKWNFLPFQPGLVGGHCIGVNSYYLLHKAEEIGCQSEVILAGRRVNDYMVKFIISAIIKNLSKLKIDIKKTRIAILGLTYKENCSDARDSKVIDLIAELKTLGADVLVHDPIADKQTAKKELGIELQHWQELNNIDVIILTVAHRYYLNLPAAEFKKKIQDKGLIIDIKEVFDPTDFNNSNIILWRL